MKPFNFVAFQIGFLLLAAGLDGRAQSNSQPATPVIIWTKPASIVYGTVLGASQLTASAVAPVPNVDPTGIYVDSGGGNDSNPGTYYAPLKTLAAVTALATTNGTRIYGKAGSVFREQWQIPVNASVYAYGTGAKPGVNGADMVSNSLFTLAPGCSNTYQAMVSPAVTTNLALLHYTGGRALACSNVLQVWDDSARVSVVTFENTNTNPALVDANPGSWWWNVTNKLLYVHPADNSNPALNGRLYEVSTRTLAIWGSSNTYMENWLGEKAGALTAGGQQGYGILGMAGGYFKSCGGGHAYYHCLGVDCTNVFNLVFDSCYGYDYEDIPTTSKSAGGSTFFGCNSLVNSTGSTIIFTNCAAVQPAFNYGTNGTRRPVAFYARGASVSGTNQNSTTTGYVFNCYAANFGGTGVQLSDSISSIYGFSSTNCAQAVVVQAPFSTNVIISNLLASQSTYGVLVQLCTNYNVTAINDTFINCTTGVWGQNSTNTPVSVASSIFINSGVSNKALFGASSVQSNLFSSVSNNFINQLACYGDGGRQIVARSDYNNFHANGNISQSSPGSRATLSDWQTATGFDPHSTQTNPAYASSLFVVTVPLAVIDGLVRDGVPLGDSVTLSGTFAYTPASGTVLNAGTNTLSVVFTPTDANYTSASASVSIHVSPAPLNVTVNSANRIYGRTNPVFGGTITGLVNGDIITAIDTSNAGADAPVGTYAILPGLVDPGNRLGNYQVTTNKGTLTVLPAAPLLTWANPAPIVYGTPLGPQQLNATANLPGSFIYRAAGGADPNTATNPPVDPANPGDGNPYWVQMPTDISAHPGTNSITLNGGQNAVMVSIPFETPLWETNFTLYVTTNGVACPPITVYRASFWCVNAPTNGTIAFGTRDGRSIMVSPTQVGSALPVPGGQTNCLTVDQAGPPYWSPKNPHLILAGNYQAVTILADPNTNQTIFMAEFDGTRWSNPRWLKVYTNENRTVQCVFPQIAFASFAGQKITVVTDSGAQGPYPAHSEIDGLVPSCTGTSYPITNGWAQFTNLMPRLVAGDEVVFSPGFYTNRTSIYATNFVANIAAGHTGCAGIVLRSSTGDPNDVWVYAGATNANLWNITNGYDMTPFVISGITISFTNTVAEFFLRGGNTLLVRVNFTDPALDDTTYLEAVLFSDLRNAYPIVARCFECQCVNSARDCWSSRGNTNAASYVQYINCVARNPGTNNNDQCLTTHHGMNTQWYGGSMSDSVQLTLNGDPSDPLYVFFASMATGDRPFSNWRWGWCSGFCNSIICATQAVTLNLTSYWAFCDVQFTNLNNNLVTTLVTNLAFGVTTNLTSNQIAFQGDAGALLHNTIWSWTGNGTALLCTNSNPSFTGNLVGGFASGILFQYSTNAVAAVNSIWGNTFTNVGTAIAGNDSNLLFVATNNAMVTVGTGATAVPGESLGGDYNLLGGISSGAYLLGNHDQTNVSAELDAIYRPVAGGNADGTGTSAFSGVGDLDYAGCAWILQPGVTSIGARSRQRVIPGATLHPAQW